MESPERLLRRVLVGGFMSNSPNRNHGNESKRIDRGRLRTSSTRSPTQTSVSRLVLTPNNFTHPTFSPLKTIDCTPISPVSSTPLGLKARTRPTTYVQQEKSQFNSSLYSSPLWLPHRKGSSPVLNLAKIDETTVLDTKQNVQEYETKSDNPGILITSPIQGSSCYNFDKIRERFESPSAKKCSTKSELVSLSIQLGLLSNDSPSLDSPSGLIISPGDGKHKRYLKFRRADITFGKFIGKGGFGCVHSGTIAGSPVAVKIVQKRRGSGIHREILQAERLAFKLNLRHENIVGIYGINPCEELRGDALILMELVASQSLQVLLEEATDDLLIRDRLDYAQQVASALSYLHENLAAHLDVKPANVLMTPDFVCKLSDFGSLTLTGSDARREEAEFTQLLGTLPYRAPELMNGQFPSTKADVYSFGITLWQMLTRESPHKNANPHTLIYQVVKFKIRPTIPETGNDVVETMYKELYTRCWSSDLNKRPDADEMFIELGKMMQHISS